MPQEPKKRHSRQRKGKRRASIRLKSPRGMYCTNCGAITLPHMVCKTCGFYKGREILILHKDASKKEQATTK